MTITRAGILTIVLLLAASAPRPAAADPTRTYLSLGDSLAFGFTDSSTPSDGNRGYVSRYAEVLAARNGGEPPHVVNLGVFGETGTTFFEGGDRIGGPLTPLMNTNYPDANTTQNALLLDTIVAEEDVAGRTIDTVTISLGPNDLFALAGSPGFSTLPPDEQAAQLGATLQAFGTNYATLLTELRTLLPRAQVLALGTYNPFPAAPDSPFAPFADPAIHALNGVIEDLAGRFGAHYVDIYGAFQGHESEYTHILDPPAGSYNVHPNDAGYAAIAGRLAAVPEPGSLVLLGVGLLAVIGYGGRCRRIGAAS